MGRLEKVEVSNVAQWSVDVIDAFCDMLSVRQPGFIVFEQVD